MCTIKLFKLIQGNWKFIKTDDIDCEKINTLHSTVDVEASLYMHQCFTNEGLVKTIYSINPLLADVVHTQ